MRADLALSEVRSEMIRRTITPGADRLAEVRGGLLCRDVSVAGPNGPMTIRRGAIVDETLWATLSGDSVSEVAVVLPEPGEIEQGEASRRFAEAIAGPGLIVEAPHQGQCVVRAASAGLLRVQASRVVRINRRGTILLATALDGRVVGPGDTVAIVKAANLWTPADLLEGALRLAGGQPVLRVARFVARTAGFLAGPRIRPRNVEAAIANLRGMLAPYRVDLAIARRSSDDPTAIADAYRECLNASVDVIFIGGSIVLDPADPFLVALEAVGARLICRGAPIDPGTMFWVAERGSSVFLGLASCELYGRRSVLDLILPYALAGEPITGGLVAELGYGGLLEQTLDARRRRE